jgi:antitoxin component of MazEF toxin-antitoxin module
MAMHLRKPLRRWGNAFGILISRKEAEALGVTEGEPVEAELQPARRTRVQDLPTMNVGPLGDLDAILDEALAERYGHR